MKKILITLLLLTVSSFAYADPWKGYPYNSHEIPNNAKPDYKILKYYLKKEIKNGKNNEGFKIKVKGTDNYKKLNFKLTSDDYVKKQMNKTALLVI